MSGVSVCFNILFTSYAVNLVGTFDSFGIGNLTIDFKTNVSPRYETKVLFVHTNGILGDILRKPDISMRMQEILIRYL